MENAVEQLIKLLEDKINSISTKIEKSKVSNSESTKTRGIIRELEENPYYIGEDSLDDEIKNLLVMLGDDELSAKTIDNMDVLKIVASARQVGLNIDFSATEMEQLKEIISVLEKIDLLLKEQNKEKERIMSLDSKVLIDYSRIYDKLRADIKGDEYITNSEIDMILGVISEQDFSFKVQILEHIRKLSNNISENRMKILESDDIEYEIVDDEEEHAILIDEDIIRKLFDKYGYEYDTMPQKLKDNLKSKCNLSRLVDVLETLENHSDFLFIKDFGRVSLQKTSGDLKREFEKLFYILRYSSRETLEYLLTDAKNRNVSVSQILDIDGVYKRVSRKGSSSGGGGNGESDDLSLSGCFEYFKENSKTFDKLSREYELKYKEPNIDLFKDILETSPEVLKTVPDLISHNIKMAEIYNIPLLEKIGSTIKIKSITNLISRDYARRLDIMIENGCYDYTVSYPTILTRELNIEKIVYERFKGTLDFWPNSGRLRGFDRNYVPADLYSVIDRTYISELEKTIPIEYRNEIEKIDETNQSYIVDDITDMLDLNHVSEPFISYNINDCFVSINKFKRVWTCLMKVNNQSFDKRKLLLYALTYNSYYSKYEFEAIREFVNSMIKEV